MTQRDGMGREVGFSWKPSEEVSSRKRGVNWAKGWWWVKGRVRPEL